MNTKNEQLESLLSEGQRLLQANQLAEAKEAFTRACELNPGDAGLWYMLSTINGQLGDMDAAAECCRRVLAIDPDHSEAHANLGNVFFAQGRHDDAVSQYQKALQIKPDHYGACYSLGNALYAMGKYDDAAAAFQAAIEINPNLFLAYVSLGHLRMQQQAYSKAVNNYAQAARLNPNDATLHNGLGLALLNLDRDAEALACFQQAVRLQPDYADALVNSGIAHYRLGHDAEALENYQRALQLSPEIPELHNNMGSIYLKRGEFDEAIACYRRALDINPRYIGALDNLRKACKLAEHLDLYVEYYRKAVALMPDADEPRRAFLEEICSGAPAGYEPWLDDELTRFFQLKEADFAPLTKFTALHLKHKHDIRSPPAEDADTVRERIAQIGGDDLFLLFLENTINTDPDLELLLTSVRRVLLMKHGQDALTPDDSRVVTALAYQCLNNEHVFQVGEQEQARVAELKKDIESRVPSHKAPDEALESVLCVFVMYERLYALDCREHLAAMPRDGWSEKFRFLLDEGLVNLLEEDRIKQEIPTLGSIEDQTSRLVQAQYEENPYPRWITMPVLENKSVKGFLSQLFPHFTPPAFLDGPIRILVAGCGTGKHPIIESLTFDNVEIVAVDISRSSLAYAVRMARKHGINNIRFMQADILGLAELDKKFHIVESIGVLHHMEEPLAGWKVLTDLLVKDGLMFIGLYSEKARQGIVAARDLIEREGLAPNKADIRSLRARILRGELGDTLHRLTASKDFYSTSGCRDLIFHSREHRFSALQLDSAMHDLGLEFIGFELDNARIKSLYQSAFPDDGEMTDLRSWDRFEDDYPQAFVRMYNFWCQKKG